MVAKGGIGTSVDARCPIPQLGLDPEGCLILQWEPLELDGEERGVTGGGQPVFNVASIDTPTKIRDLE